MDPAEKEIEEKLIRIIKSHGGECLKWVCPGWAGVPDRICLLPGGKIIFVELKRTKGGKVSSRQMWWASKLAWLGFTHLIIKDDAGLATIERIIVGRTKPLTCKDCAHLHTFDDTIYCDLDQTLKIHINGYCQLDLLPRGSGK